MMTKRKFELRQGWIGRIKATVCLSRVITWVEVLWIAKTQSSRMLIWWVSPLNMRRKGWQRLKDLWRCLVLLSGVGLSEFLPLCTNLGLLTGLYWILSHLSWPSLRPTCSLLVSYCHLSRLKRCTSSGMFRWANGVSTWFHSSQLCAMTVSVWSTS